LLRALFDWVNITNPYGSDAGFAWDDDNGLRERKREILTNTMLSILNVAIGIAFVYLLLSLLVSALNEILLCWFDKRADFLKEALQQLLQDEDKVTQLLKHGLVDALSRKTEGTPSYIGAEPFTAAVLDIIRPADPKVVRTIDDFKTAVASLPPESKLRQSLSAILDEANNSVTAFKRGVSCWYDRSMDRVTGWYKHYAQTWLFWLGLAVAIACNVDSIHILQALSINPQLAAEAANVAADYLKTHKDASATSSPAPTPTPASPSASASESAPASPSPSPSASVSPPVTITAGFPSPSPSMVGASATPSPSLQSLITNVQTALGDIQNLRLPIGWDASQRAYFWDEHGVHKNRIVTGLIGWLLTALAVSLGAPFWFDILQRFVNIRANGRSPDEKDIGTKK
jgi:hypothetical protein